MRRAAKILRDSLARVRCTRRWQLMILAVAAWWLCLQDYENELIINESLHGEQLVFDENQVQNSTEEKVKETMKKAFWDRIIESVEQNEPNFGRILELMKEVRDEIAAMAPGSWKQEIFEAIDIDILSQVLSSGNVDMNYLGRILGFALDKLQQLSAPASLDKLKATHLKFLEELAGMCSENDSSSRSHTVALVKGLRFVLEEIHILKQEVSRARIQILQPLLMGAGGFSMFEVQAAAVRRQSSGGSAVVHRWSSKVAASWKEELGN